MATKKVQPLQVTADRNWQFGSVVFQKLPDRFGGYQSLTGLNQILINYRTAPPAAQVTLQQVLQRASQPQLGRESRCPDWHYGSRR